MTATEAIEVSLSWKPCTFAPGTNVPSERRDHKLTKLESAAKSKARATGDRFLHRRSKTTKGNLASGCTAIQGSRGFGALESPSRLSLGGGWGDIRERVGALRDLRR